MPVYQGYYCLQHGASNQQVSQPWLVVTITSGGRGQVAVYQGCYCLLYHLPVNMGWDISKFPALVGVKSKGGWHNNQGNKWRYIKAVDCLLYHQPVNNYVCCSTLVHRRWNLLKYGSFIVWFTFEFNESGYIDVKCSFIYNNSFK